MRELPPGERPRDWIDEGALALTAEAASKDVEPAPARQDLTEAQDATELKSLKGFAAAQPAPLTGPQRYRVQFTAKDEYVQLVERAKALLSHTSAGCSLEELHLRAMQALVAQLEKRKYAVKTSPSRLDREVAGADADTDADTPFSSTRVAGKSPRQRDRYVPAVVRRAVYARDEARCAHVDATGERCSETHRLELHHLVPFARGGADTVDNMSLRCRCHNLLAAEQDFGRAVMEKAQERQRHEAFARQGAPAGRETGV